MCLFALCDPEKKCMCKKASQRPKLFQSLFTPDSLLSPTQNRPLVKPCFSDATLHLNANTCVDESWRARCVQTLISFHTTSAKHVFWPFFLQRSALCHLSLRANPEKTHTLSLSLSPNQMSYPIVSSNSGSTLPGVTSLDHLRWRQTQGCSYIYTPRPHRSSQAFLTSTIVLFSVRSAVNAV